MVTIPVSVLATSSRVATATGSGMALNEETRLANFKPRTHVLKSNYLIISFKNSRQSLAIINTLPNQDISCRLC